MDVARSAENNGDYVRQKELKTQGDQFIIDNDYSLSFAVHSASPGFISQRTRLKKVNILAL